MHPVSKYLIIWIIDDDEIVRFVMKKNFKMLQQNLIVEFSEATTPLKILNTIDKTPEKLPDIIFLDINLPVVGGFAFIDDFKKISNRLRKPIRVFMLSASMNPAEISKAKTIPEVTDYLSKPLELPELKAIIEQA